MAGQSQFVAGRSPFVAGRSRFAACLLICGRSENDKCGTKHGARADSRLGPRFKVIDLSKEDISKKKK